MGKKSKSKKQRRDYHYQPNTPTTHPVSKPVESMLTPVEGAPALKAAVAPSDDYIRRDIIRILILIGIIVLLLITTVIVSHKSTIIARAGHRFASFLQL